MEEDSGFRLEPKVDRTVEFFTKGHEKSGEKALGKYGPYW